MNSEIIKHKLLSIPKVIECGNHSGFPSCCIKFYCCDYIWMSQKKRDKYRMEIDKKQETAIIPIEYIPCPSCLRKDKIVKSKRCPQNSYCCPGEWAELAS